MKERNGGIPTTGEKRGGGPSDIPFGLGVWILSAQKFRSVTGGSGASSLEGKSV